MGSSNAIILVGHSLLVEGVASLLRQNEKNDVTVLDMDDSMVMEKIAVASPATVILEAEFISLHQSFSFDDLVKLISDLRILLLHQEGNQTQIITGEFRETRSIEDLVEVIHSAD